MPLNIKRAKITLLASASFTTIGMFLAAPQWPAIGIAVLVGVPSALIMIADIRKKETRIGAFALLPLIVGVMIARNYFSGELVGRANWGSNLQLYGIAMTTAIGISFIYLLIQNEKKTG